MHTDICNCQVSLTDAAAVAEWNGMILGFLSHAKTVPGYLKRLLEMSPDYAMAYAAKGLFAMMMGKRELIAAAQEANQNAQNAMAQGGATRREQSWCAALDCWVNGRPLQAVQCIESALRDNPADTMSMKVSHADRIKMGDNVGMRRSIERVIAAHDEEAFRILFAEQPAVHRFTNKMADHPREVAQLVAAQQAQLVRSLLKGRCVTGFDPPHHKVAVLAVRKPLSFSVKETSMDGRPHELLQIVNAPPNTHVSNGGRVPWKG